MPTPKRALARSILAFAAGLGLAAGTVRADPASDDVAFVRDCMKKNVPKESSVQSARFLSTDRVGGTREFRGKIVAKRMDDGKRRAKLCVLSPQDIRGSEMLSIENEAGAPDSFLYTEELRKTKRITGEGLGGSVFGTDFTFEDFQRFMNLNRVEVTKRLADAELEGRKTYVLETRPIDPTTSSYVKVVSWIDAQTCVVLKSESFEHEDRPRRELTADPKQIQTLDGVSWASHVTMRDLRDETHTTLDVEDSEFDAEVKDRALQPSELGRHCR